MSSRKVTIKRVGGYDPRLGSSHPSNRDKTLEGRPTVNQALRPMSEAPTTGPVVEILVATSNRAGCNGWLIAHNACGGGEEQPRFRGWFFWTGVDFQQIDESTLLGWLPLPTLARAPR